MCSLSFCFLCILEDYYCLLTFTPASICGPLMYSYCSTFSIKLNPFCGPANQESKTLSACSWAKLVCLFVSNVLFFMYLFHQW